MLVYAISVALSERPYLGRRLLYSCAVVVPHGYGDATTGKLKLGNVLTNNGALFDSWVFFLKLFSEPCTISYLVTRSN